MRALQPAATAEHPSPELHSSYLRGQEAGTVLLAELGAMRAKARHWLGTLGPLNRICSQGSPTAGGTTSGRGLFAFPCEWGPGQRLDPRCHSAPLEVSQRSHTRGRSLILSRINHLVAKCPVHPLSLQRVERQQHPQDKRQPPETSSVCPPPSAAEGASLDKAPSSKRGTTSSENPTRPKLALA